MLNENEEFAISSGRCAVCIFDAACSGDQLSQRRVYLDYANNFTCVSTFARYYGVDYNHAYNKISEWREVHEKYVKGLKQC